MPGSISSTEKRGRGRPRINPVAQHFTMPQALSAAIDDWIADQPEPKPKRPEAIRRLIERGLDAAEKIPIQGAHPGGLGSSLTSGGVQNQVYGAGPRAPRR
jgi:hypothetical protein